MDAIGFRIDAPETKPVEPWRKVLTDAADYIEAHGWWTLNPSPRSFWQRLVQPVHPNQIGGTRVCAMLSLSRTHGHTYEWAIAHHNFKAFLGVEIDHWNDAPGRTAAEVCAALRACAVS